VTEPDGVLWPELDEAIPEASRDRLNPWLVSMGIPEIEESVAYRPLVESVFQGLGAEVDWQSFDLMDVEPEEGNI